MGRSTKLRLGELFCGPGGMALGAMRAGFEHAWATDLDPDACATYRRNIGEPVICANVRDLALSSLGPVDVLAFGFPCNDFSIVGEKRGMEGPYGPLYRYGVRVLQTHRPLAFVAENVSGLASANDGRAFSLIRSELEGEGYTLATHLYRAEEYGVPQTRRRYLIVGLRSDLGVSFDIPPPTTPGCPVTACEALLDIGPGAPNHERTRQSAAVIARLRHIPPGGNAWSAEIPPELRLNVKGATLSQIYRRLEPDKPAYTITGSGGGGTHVYHWSEPRALTNRERARLQSFPDDFVFCGSKESVRRQIGMAVPPLLAEAVFRQLENVLRTCRRQPPQWVESSRPGCRGDARR